MASLPVQPPITARIDTAGRLVAADPPLLALQEQAGARLGSALAVPQLAALARLAARLGVALTRPVRAASEEEDLDLIVHALPDTDGVTLSVERWTAHPPVRSRWMGGGRVGEEAEAEVRAAAEDLVTDHGLRIVSVSPGLARRVGEAATDVAGHAISRLVRPIEDAEGNLPLLEALAGRVAFAGQPALLRPDDTPVMLDGEPRVEDDQFLGYAIRVRSPDAPTAARGAAMLPLDDLLRDPLASIIGQAEEIAGRSQGPLKTDYAGYGTDIATAARHLLELLAALGEGASDGTGEGTSGAGGSLDLAELVLDAAGLVQAEASARQIMLDVGGEGSLAARGQPRAVTQILVNLIGNAVRFSPAGGTVTIMLERGPGVAVTIADQGPGVPPADRQRIFERFEQGSEARGGSAGLGLAISRRLAREMGGEVELLDLAAPGAVFRLTLPAA